MKAETEFIEGLIIMKLLDSRNPPADFEDYRWRCWSTPPDQTGEELCSDIEEFKPLFYKYFLVPKELINIIDN